MGPRRAGPSDHLASGPADVPNAAALFAVLGIGLWCARPGGSRRIRVACAIAVAGVAALTAAQDLFGFALGIDDWIVRVPTRGQGSRRAHGSSPRACASR
jgi:hypothetical protein